ncbi:hypothetical protein LTR78_001667 [Recurvomyces mirabilis]|uniref:Uncharacterized protein n=1 Tax=Recurvomyces mirabilis TaxID=574656 RepID=A0AAE0WVH2_9PEZI|nr:hypothetical protein LTR78_001667 [Recurvomyces mirabilis]KAK5151763.1 hypothetical protein LTS14_008895 [Recurvomyces mirabilis]
MAALNSIGLFTQAGWLYEGNYPEWRSRIAALDALENRARGSTYQELFFEREDRLKALMLENLSPQLLDRVPDQDRDTFQCLEAALLARCRPFQLFGLPVEIRSAMYGYNMRIRYDLQHGLAKVSGRKAFFPPLLYSSSAVRTEALPVFFSQTLFSHQNLVPHQPNIINEVVRFFGVIEKRCYRHLRRFMARCYIDDYMICFDVTITYHPGVGLDVKFSDDETREDGEEVMDEALRERI